MNFKGTDKTTKEDDKHIKKICFETKHRHETFH